MADLDNQESLSNASDCSFVILGHGSIPVDETQDHLKENFKDESVTNSKSTCSDSKCLRCNNNKCQCTWFTDPSSSFIEEDTQKKLDEIIKENFQLKETLVQNNLAIKSQLDTFFMWQQEVLKTHEIHKQKFLEMKDLILKLRAENINLKKQLGESVARVSNTKEKDVFVQVDKNPEELDQLKEKMKEIENICNELTNKNESLVMENEKLREELKCENREILNLNKSLQRFEKEVEFVKHGYEDSKKNSLESSLFMSLLNTEAQVQIHNLLKQLEEEKGKVAKLNEELKKAKPKKEVKKSTTEELNECIDKIDDMNASLERQNQKFNSLHNWVAFAEGNLKESKAGEGEDNNLVREINKLKNDLNQKEIAFQEKQEYLQELRSHFNKLLLDYQNLQLQLKTIQNNDPNIEHFVMEISNLSYELENTDRKLLSKEEECEKLREVVQNLQAESEEVTALRVQVELYRADFNDERKQKEQLFAEKEHLVGRVENLETRILQLEQEKELPERKQRIICPKCVISFSDLETYNNHREECCNIDFLF